MRFYCVHIHRFMGAQYSRMDAQLSGHQCITPTSPVKTLYSQGAGALHRVLEPTMLMTNAHRSSGGYDGPLTYGHQAWQPDLRHVEYSGYVSPALSAQEMIEGRAYGYSRGCDEDEKGAIKWRDVAAAGEELLEVERTCNRVM